MRLSIKNMVCGRCLLVVKQEFEHANIKLVAASLGEVELKKPLNKNELETIGKRLADLGFEILDSKNERLIEKLKSVLIKQVQSGEIEERFSLSEFISDRIGKEYTQVSRLFSEVEGITLEHFFILQKLEKVKELLTYDELSLSEISFRLGYSSVAHLSAQFKKMTGFTPSAFKKNGIAHRLPLDRIQRRK